MQILTMVEEKAEMMGMTRGWTSAMEVNADEYRNLH